MNRLYVAESMPTITGAKADHRLPVRPSEIRNLAFALAAELGIAGFQSETPLADGVRKWISAVARDLQSHRGTSIVTAGDNQPAEVHAVVHAINDALGNANQTVRYINSIEARPTNQIAELKSLVEEMAAGEVRLLLILGANPVFTAPADLEFAKHLTNVPLRIHLGLYADETARFCDWHIPEAHFLESWGDGRTFDGTASIIQPLIAPLYGGRSAQEVLAGLFEGVDRPGYEIVRGYWRQHWPTSIGDAEFDRQWEQSLKDGVIADTAFRTRNDVTVRRDLEQPHLPYLFRGNHYDLPMRHGMSPMLKPSRLLFNPIQRFPMDALPTTGGSKNYPSRSRS